MIILGINAYHPDASVALLKDGVLLWAAEEERFNRIKHASGFPELALQNALKETGISVDAIDAVAISRDPHANLLPKLFFVMKQRPSFTLLKDRLAASRKAAQFETDFWDAVQMRPGNSKARFIHVEHHQAHVASSFYLSGMEKAAFLTLDGLGDFSSAMWGVGEGNHLQILDRILFPHSAGFLYTAATQFLGFHHFGDEFKVMGLAGYGKPSFLEPFRRIVRLKPKGRFELNLKFFVHHQGKAKIRWEGGAPEQDLIFSSEWKNIFGKARKPKEPVTQREMDFAASLQAILEEIYFHVLNHLYQVSHEKNLCLAGGVAFNSVANGKITKKTPFQNIYIQPAAGDSGAAVGAAIFVSRTVFNEPRKFEMQSADFGPSAKDSEIEQALRTKNIPVVKLEESQMIRKTVEHLEKGNVVGWFQGRMEFGPRALGKRSILADPRRHDMKDVLNQRIKHRETFRPFAPAVLEEKANDYFEMDCKSTPFMLKVFPVKSEKREVLPAITHVDGTARVQTVSREMDPIFWKLIQEFGNKTGVYVLLNTSFNENEPIVCRPEEAIDCFLKTKMDLLVMGNYIIEKESSRSL